MADNIGVQFVEVSSKTEEGFKEASETILELVNPQPLKNNYQTNNDPVKNNKISKKCNLEIDSNLSFYFTDNSQNILFDGKNDENFALYEQNNTKNSLRYQKQTDNLNGTLNHDIEKPINLNSAIHENEEKDYQSQEFIQEDGKKTNNITISNNCSMEEFLSPKTYNKIFETKVDESIISKQYDNDISSQNSKRKKSNENMSPRNIKVNEVSREPNSNEVSEVEVTYQVFMNPSQKSLPIEEATSKSITLGNGTHQLDKSELDNLKLFEEDDMAYTPDISMNYRSKYIKDDISTIQV